MNQFQLLVIYEMLGPILYIMMWILGYLDPEYNHIRRNIGSSLGDSVILLFSNIVVITTCFLLLV